MAITERYVRSDAAGGGDGTTDANSGANGAFTWAEMITDLNTPRVGYRYNVKSGTYSLSATTAPTGDGTTATPNIIRGFKTTPGDLDTQGRLATGELDTTDFPVIAYNAPYFLNIGGSDNLIVANLVVTGTRYGAMVGSGAGIYSVLRNVKVTNASTNAAAVGISQVLYTERCDVDMSGGSGTLCAFDVYTSGTAIDCRVINAPAIGFRFSASNGVAAFCVVDSCGTDAFAFTPSVTTFVPPRLINCTSYAAGSDHLSVSDAAYTYPTVVYGCQFTDDGSGYAFNNAGSGSRNIALISSHNRRRDNANDQVGFTDWLAATDWEAIGPTTTGDASTDYIDAANGDFRPAIGAPGISAADCGALDIGAVQMAQPTLPSASDVWHGVTSWGYSWSYGTGTKDASSITVSGGAGATLTAPDIKTGVTVDPTPGANIEGSAAGGGSVIVIED